MLSLFTMDGFGMNTKDTRTRFPSVGSPTGLPPYRSFQLHHASSQRNDRAALDLPLDFVADDAALPRRLADTADAKLYKRRLVSLCRHLEERIETSVSVSYNREGRIITVFGCVAYRIDDCGKTLTPGRVDRNGQFQAGSHRVEVLRPLCTSWWLRWVIEDLGLSDRSDQGHLFLSDVEIGNAETWLADTAYRLLKPDPRFRRIRFDELPRALNLAPDLVTIALRARACTRGLHLVSDLF